MQDGLSENANGRTVLSHCDVFNLLEMRKTLLVGEDKAHYFILSKSGFADDIRKLAVEHDNIHLVTGEDLFGRSF